MGQYRAAFALLLLAVLKRVGTFSPNESRMIDVVYVTEIFSDDKHE